MLSVISNWREMSRSDNDWNVGPQGRKQFGRKLTSRHHASITDPSLGRVKEGGSCHG